MKYIAGKEAFYDEEKMLFGCYIGAEGSKTLLATVWANSESRAIQKAQAFAEILSCQKAAGRKITPSVN